jgi:hypothetical protein
LGQSELKTRASWVSKFNTIAVLLDQTFPGSASELPSVEAALRTLGAQPIVVDVAGERGFLEVAFATVFAAGPAPWWSSAALSSPATVTSSSLWRRATPSP